MNLGTSTMKVFLVVQNSGPMHGKKIPVTASRFTIGRDPKSSLQADHPTIADAHCALEIAGERFLLRDFNGPAGTIVNDVRIKDEAQLQNGDRLTVGPLRFLVNIEAGEKSIPAAPKPANIKVSLVMQVAGPLKGKKVPITIPVFTIGRDPRSSLQAESPAIAPRHCSLEVRKDSVFARDWETPGGTFVNDKRIAGESEIHNGDQLKVGPLLFSVTIEVVSVPATTTKPKPKPEKKEPVNDGSASFAAHEILKKFNSRRKDYHEDADEDID